MPQVDNCLYYSCQGMIPILRNCFVYFEMLVSTIPLLNTVLHHALLSIIMLVGTCNGLVILCSTA